MKLTIFICFLIVLHMLVGATASWNDARLAEEFALERDCFVAWGDATKPLSKLIEDARLSWVANEIKTRDKWISSPAWKKPHLVVPKTGRMLCKLYRMPEDDGSWGNLRDAMAADGFRAATLAEMLVAVASEQELMQDGQVVCIGSYCLGGGGVNYFAVYVPAESKLTLRYNGRKWEKECTFLAIKE